MSRKASLHFTVGKFILGSTFPDDLLLIVCKYLQSKDLRNIFVLSRSLHL